MYKKRLNKKGIKVVSLVLVFSQHFQNHFLKAVYSDLPCSGPSQQFLWSLWTLPSATPECRAPVRCGSGYRWTELLFKCLNLPMRSPPSAKPSLCPSLWQHTVEELDKPRSTRRVFTARSWATYSTEIHTPGLYARWLHLLTCWETFFFLFIFKHCSVPISASDSYTHTHTANSMVWCLIRPVSSEVQLTG